MNGSTWFDDSCSDASGSDTSSVMPTFMEPSAHYNCIDDWIMANRLASALASSNTTDWQGRPTSPMAQWPMDLPSSYGSDLSRCESPLSDAHSEQLQWPAALITDDDDGSWSPVPAGMRTGTWLPPPPPPPPRRKRAAAVTQQTQASQALSLPEDEDALYAAMLGVSVSPSAKHEDSAAAAGYSGPATLPVLMAVPPPPPPPYPHPRKWQQQQQAAQQTTDVLPSGCVPISATPVGVGGQQRMLAVTVLVPMPASMETAPGAPLPPPPPPPPRRTHMHLPPPPPPPPRRPEAQRMQLTQQGASTYMPSVRLVAAV